MAFDPKSVPEHFWEAFDAGRCGLFVGAGLSSAAGLPDWPGLLEELIKVGERERLITDVQAKDCRTVLQDSSKFLMLATELKDLLGSAFPDYIERRFYEECPQPTDAHRKLINIDQFRFLITTNYDVLIENAYTERKERPRILTYSDAGQIQRSLYKRMNFFLKAHGSAEKAAEEIILTEHDYRRVLYKEPAYRSSLEAIFTMYSVVFVGSSLRDPEVNLLLQYINAAFSEGSGGPTHYAVMAKEDCTELERGRWRKDFNTHFIEVSKKNGFAELSEFLDILKARPPAKKA